MDSVSDNTFTRTHTQIYSHTQTDRQKDRHTNIQTDILTYTDRETEDTHTHTFPKQQTPYPDPMVF